MPESAAAARVSARPIVRIIGRIITVSLETIKMVEALPSSFVETKQTVTAAG